jgi:hypothetical protein
MNYHFEDFTETEYRKLVRMAIANWQIVPFTDCRNPGRICLWRHDIDLSPHRALRLAEIEADEGLHATYYVLLHSQFYNFLEREIRQLLRRIAAIGHYIGLHFDPVFYDRDELTGRGLPDKLTAERELLQELLDVHVATFSYHNSDLIPAEFKADAEEIAGMTNASNSFIRRQFTYCSDSNGYWRYGRLREVLQPPGHERLHVLTHPDWWAPTPMSPRDRVSRCIEGRARKQHEWYDSVLAQLGRINVR